MGIRALSIIWLLGALFVCQKTAVGQNDPATDSLARAEAKELYNKVKQAFYTDDYTTALKHNKEYKEFIQTNFGEKDSLYGMSLSTMGVLYRRLGDQEKAYGYLKRAVVQTRETLGEEHSSYGSRLNNLALFYQSNNELDKAKENLYLALENIRSNYGEEHREYALLLSNIADLHRRLGETLLALEQLIAAHAIYENLEDGIPRIRVSIKTRLGNLYKNLGYFENAYLLHRECLQLIEEEFGVGHPVSISTLNSLGSLLLDLGFTEDARRYFNKSLELNRKFFGEDHLENFKPLNGIAGAYKKINEPKKALEYYNKSLRLLEENEQQNSANYSTVLTNKASVYIYTQLTPQKSLPLLKHAKELSKKIYGEDHLHYALRLKKMGFVYLNLNKNQLAAEHLYQALDIIDQSMGKDNPTYGTILRSLGLLYENYGQMEKARDYFLLTNAHIESFVRDVIALGSDKDMLHELQRLQVIFDDLFTLGLKSEFQDAEINKVLYQNTLNNRGLATKRMSNLFQRINNSGDEELRKRFNEWNSLRSRIASEYTKPTELRDRNLDSLIAVAGKMETSLINASVAFEDFMNQVHWEEIRDRLGPGEVAIEIIHSNIGRRILDYQSVVYGAAMISREYENPKIVKLFKESELKEKLAREEHQSEEDFINSLYASPESGLYELIFSRLEEKLADKSTIYYSTAGLLSKINFNALMTPEGEFLSERHDLVQLWSTADLMESMIIPTDKTAWLAGGIEYGLKEKFEDPQEDRDEQFFAFNELRSAVSRGELSSFWESLPDTRKEVEAINKKLESGSSNLLTGKYATESAFKSICGNSPSIIHLATHGFFFADQQSEFNPEEDESSFNDPLFRSGLILAGGNYSWINGYNPIDKEDGILTAFEIANLDLSGSNLAVLSACETGLGDLSRTDGVQGLQRAFKIAGVDQLIISLWKVPDQTSRELMTAFYSHWFSGKTTREAFAEAQREMAQRYPPFYWGGFVLIQSGVEALPQKQGTPWIPLVGFGLLILLLSFFVWRIWK